MGISLDWSVFLQELPEGGVFYWEMLLSGLWWTLGVAACSWIIAMLCGSVIGTLRTTESRVLVFLGNAWVELFRNIPLLVQMVLWYFVVPELVPPLKAWVVAAEPSHAQFLSATLCLGLFTSARIAEQVRAGIQSLPRGQRFAGLALGLTTAQTYRFVLLPMAFRIVIPPLTSEAMNIIKNSSVAFAVSISELTLFAMQAQEETSRGIEVYLAVTTLYIATALAVNRVMALIERRIRIPGTVGGDK